MKASKLLLYALFYATAFCACKKDDSIKPELTVAPESLSFARNEGTQELIVTSNVQWTAVSDQSWCTVTPTQGEGNKTITIEITENDDIAERTAKITVQVKNGTFKREITVTQSGAAPSITVIEKNVTLEWNACAIDVEILANTPFTVTVVEAGWIQQAPSETGTQTTTTLRFNIAENNTDSEREGRVVFSMEGDDAVSDTLYVKQHTETQTYRIADSLALIAFYEATNGDGWDNNTKWKTHPLDQWYGVYLENNRVTTLVLTNNSLTGNIPAQIGELSELTYLYLSENQLSGSIPAELGNLSKLRIAYLEANRLTNAMPSQLGNIDSLEVLKLSDNQLTGEIPPELGNLSKLQELYLSYNQLNGSIPPELANLNNLTTIEIINNALTGNIPPELADMDKLFLLDLSENQLTGGIPPGLGDMNELTILMLFGNRLSGTVAASILDKVNNSDEYVYIICPQEGTNFDNHDCE